MNVTAPRKKYFGILFTLFIVSLLLVTTSPVAAKRFNVLVVMSYEEKNPWCQEIKEGIDSVLADASDITYFYMDTKMNLEGGPEKAKEAYALFQQKQYDGVITADDNAQQMFVLPYLRGAHKTPVMFCGVNADPEKYGFPTPQVSGILERGHIRESIALAKQLVPSVKKVAFLTRDSPSGRALLQQVQHESDTYLAKTSFHLVRDVEDLREIANVLGEQSDAIYIDSMEGIIDETGEPLTNRQVIEVLTANYNKPIIGANQYHVEQGALCAVVKTGQEQGKTAAEMLLKAMQGAPVEEIPVVKNFMGKRVINVATVRSLNLQIRPIVLLGAKLIKSGE